MESKIGTVKAAKLVSESLTQIIPNDEKHAITGYQCNNK